MRTATIISLWIVRTAGAVQLVSGTLLWTGLAAGFLPLHMASGVAIVLTLWTLAALALAARARSGLAIFALVWGLALPALGFRQAALLVGPMHWIIRVIHLLMGLIALALAMRLAQAILATRSSDVHHSELDRGPVGASRAP
jgi:hypothetical protein